MTARTHPEPPPATVKRLYALAFRCAKPDCTRPLYRQDNETADLVLNSRIAHIHARRPGGPRWIEMSSEDNRADDNLLLLCIEHSYEVDELPDQYPAELLREWKQAQRDEHDQLQRGWPLTDADAGRVLEASSQAVDHHHAGAILGVVRAAERLALSAERHRVAPAARAADWRAARARVRHEFFAWDQDGNPVHAEPSRHETDGLSAALRAALQDEVNDLIPLANDTTVELAAARASRPAVAPWCAWVGRAVDEVIAASSTWPGPPGLEDDDRLPNALAALRAAADSLAAVWRGEAADAPPEVPPPDLTPPTPDPLEGHRALLDRARPYARVHHRPYDAALRAELAVAAEQAAGIPPVPSALTIGLSATCRLAAAVAANADDAQIMALMEEDSRRRPLSTAVLLLAESERLARDRGRPALEEAARCALVDLWESLDLSDPYLWMDGDANLPSVLWEASRRISPEAVNGQLTGVLAQEPDLVLPLVVGCAPWEESRQFDDWSLTGIRRRHRELPPWFPVDAVVAAAATVAPGVSKEVVNEFGETDGDDAESLLAQVLWLADARATP
ncbi:hypothetical protein [Cellulomonas xiejunii]|uniref:hypothetical protein n=1 Tax=Cellulomonas xiejunii TaxID=2968083 RepID=UPI001D0F38BB|nr:hypothetical protein [Cellulomonas xiejunii]MCC2315614.1 hypothetical protein [Cellulomonas xiejunii]